jgi:2-methylisocitrate lyase-like PEP mutase family enzyme
MTQLDRAMHFRRLHEVGHGTILLLPNAWDAMSARIIEDAGAPAIATTSCGVSWALGRPDGQGLSRDEMIEAVRRIAGVVKVPVTADIEGGYGTGTPSDVLETVKRVVDAGAVGINLEDTPGRNGSVLVAPREQAERITAARAAAQATGVPVFVNARIDVYLFQVGDPAGRVDETISRARIYADAGADGIFVPGVVDPETIGRMVEAIGVPLNVMAGPGAPTTAELAALGVARVSVGPGIARAVATHIRRAAAELLAAGTYEALRDGAPFAEINDLFVTT